MAKSTASASLRFQTKNERLSSAEVFLQQSIVEWFRKEARALPWRSTKDPYKIWLSEIMAQQTGVSTVIPYYIKFITRYPSVFDLAKASETEVIRMWEGLGYYSRARNLLKAAQIVAQKFSGKFPRTREELLSLPGIGEYSAGAILSIAFSLREAALDGNLIRVFSRYFGEEGFVDDREVLRDLWQQARRLPPKDPGRIRDYTEGLMDLGATVCRPKNPLCLLCPLSRHCVAQRRGLAAILPRKEKRIIREKRMESVFFEQRRNKIAIYPKGSDPKFPYFYRLPFLDEWTKKKEIFSMKYSVTFRDFQVKVHRGLKKSQHKIIWADPEKIETFSFPAIDRKILKKFSLESSKVQASAVRQKRVFQKRTNR